MDDLGYWLLFFGLVALAVGCLLLARRLAPTAEQKHAARQALEEQRTVGLSAVEQERFRGGPDF